jgi:uncharacterized protein YciI
MGVAMDFDRFSVALLVLGDNPPLLSDIEAAELQDSHMAHLADLHEAGQLLAAGPLTDDHFRGLSILNVDEDTARRLLEEDPAVRAGMIDVLVVPWMVPAGAVRFLPTKFPRSMREVG